MEISNIKRKKKEKTLSVVYGYDFPKKKRKEERRKKFLIEKKLKGNLPKC